MGAGQYLLARALSRYSLKPQVKPMRASTPARSAGKTFVAAVAPVASSAGRWSKRPRSIATASRAAPVAIAAVAARATRWRSRDFAVGGTALKITLMCRASPAGVNRSSSHVASALRRARRLLSVASNRGSPLVDPRAMRARWLVTCCRRGTAYPHEALAIAVGRAVAVATRCRGGMLPIGVRPVAIPIGPMAIPIRRAMPIGR